VAAVDRKHACVQRASRPDLLACGQETGTGRCDADQGASVAETTQTTPA
jgi:hypothetical protein